MSKKLLWAILFFILVGVSAYLVLGGKELLPTQKVIDKKSGGIIFGTVALGPSCPVVSDPPDPECEDKPYQTKLELVTQGGIKVVKKFSSDTNGKFSINIPPGEYLIRSAPSDEIFPYCLIDDIVTVQPNESVEVMVLCDTGIR